MQRSILFSFFPSSMPQPLKSGLLLAFGISMLGLSDSLVPLISDDMGLGQFHFLRSIIAVSGVLVIARMTGLGLWPERWSAVLLRSAAIIMAMMLFFSVLSFLPSAIAGAGLFTSPIFVLILLAVCYGILPGRRRLIAVGLGSAGVWLVLRPDMASFDILHVIPVIAGAFYAGSIIITNRYCADESPMCLSLFYFTGLGLAGLAVACWFSLFPSGLGGDTRFMMSGFDMISLSSLFWVIVMAVLTIISVWMLTVAYQSADASYLVVFEYSYLISAGITGWLIWGNLLSLSNIAGMVLIIGAGSFISRRTARI
jgi:drug/metabolite transporter (DMT)-like permease